MHPLTTLDAATVPPDLGLAGSDGAWMQLDPSQALSQFLGEADTRNRAQRRSNAAAPAYQLAALAKALPRDHPAQVLARTGDRSLTWRAAQAQTPPASEADQAAPSQAAKAEAARMHPEWLDDAEQMRRYAVHERMAELAENCDRSAIAAAATLIALAELLDTTGDAPTDDVADDDASTAAWPAEPDDWPPQPPPQHLALTTSTLTAAPPAPAPPVSEALRRVILAA